MQEEGLTKKTRGNDDGMIQAVGFDEIVDLDWMLTLPEEEIHVPRGMDLEQVRAAKLGALKTLEHYGVYEDRPTHECAGIKRIRARWEPQQRSGT